jgi:hypothetical protein
MAKKIHSIRRRFCLTYIASKSFSEITIQNNYENFTTSVAVSGRPDNRTETEAAVALVIGNAVSVDQAREYKLKAVLPTARVKTA